MPRTRALFVLCAILTSFSVSAQNKFIIETNGNKKDTAIFYYKYPDKMITMNESPDFIRLILPPDSSVDKDLFVVKDFYPNGKLKMLCNSSSNINPLLRGAYIEFFPNGKRKGSGSYANGKAIYEKSTLTGIATAYYPNGKVLSVRDYLDGTKYKLTECRDSAGNLLADKGNGHWIEYNERFDKVLREGAIVGGLEDGEWKECRDDTINYITTYKKGRFLSGVAILKSGKRYEFTQFDTQPGIRNNNTVGAFFKNRFQFPDDIKSKVKSGSVIVSLNVDEKGEVSNIKLMNGLSPNSDTEALRLIKMSAKEWHPAYQNGIPKKSECEVIFNFSTFSAGFATNSADPRYTNYVSVLCRSKILN